MACTIVWSSSEWCHSHHDILTKTKILKETSGWMARMGLLKDSGMLLSSTWNFRSVDLTPLLSSEDFSWLSYNKRISARARLSPEPADL